MKRLIALIPMAALTGCVVEVRHPYVVERRPVYVEETAAPAVAVEAPVYQGPGVVVIDVEPAPVDRVYVYDPGFPPGCYFYNNYYWFGGYRYEHDVFIDRFVSVNIRERRYIDIEENRRLGADIEVRQRTDFERTGGRRDPNYVAKLRAGQEKRAKAYEYGEKLKAAGNKEEQEKFRAGQKEEEAKIKAGDKEYGEKVRAGEKLKAADAKEEEAKVKAGDKEYGEKVSAGDKLKEAGAKQEEAKVKAGQKEQAEFRSNVQQSGKTNAQQEKERLNAAQQKKDQKKPQEHQ